MIPLKINNIKILSAPNVSVLEACQYIGIYLPRFCYHEILSVAGNCRMCLVEIEKSPKPVVACAMPVVNNMVILTNSPLVKKARENVLELLLINHPLDCPICDQGGECDLQDQIQFAGSDFSRFFKNKRIVEDKILGLSIKTIMTRCIHCTRCVRFSEELTESPVFGTLSRGGSTEIGSYLNSVFNSEISGNVVDLCPVGALTLKSYTFKSRPWELKNQETIDCTDGFGSNILVNFKETDILRIQPKISNSLNLSLISDKIRFLHDGILKNRIKQIFLKDLNESYRELDLIKFLTEFKILINNLSTSNKTLLFIVNETIDLETIVKLNFLNNKKIQLVTKSNNFLSKNYYFNPSLFVKSFLLDNLKLKVCFIIGSNIKIESTILNTKLRIKFNKEKIKFYNLGLKTTSTSFNSIFINLNLNKIIKGFEGKTEISLKIFEFASPLIIFGNSLKKRIKNMMYVISLLKKISSTSIFFNVNLNSNSEGVYYLGLKNLSSKQLKNASNVFYINLEDNFTTRKILTNLNFLIKNFWFNTHGSSLALKANFIIPTQTFFELENLYLNNDRILQKTKIILNFKDNFNYLDNILIILKDIMKQKNNYNFYSFKKEIVKYTPNIFFYSNINKNYIFKSIISDYPFKSFFEDFFLTNNITKNSQFLLKRSQEYRKIFNPFYKIS
uniref:NADH dehydrogenase subunit 11 n=1 Tax=Synura synuroidea TaxID=47573 RepID=Q9MGB3_9STRA|nr:NADH dehydrogenase subunit 11 [Synura synuroidea]AAF36936.1 NADH dehydrogenase subunit 11 [Synura synuroidea]